MIVTVQNLTQHAISTDVGLIDPMSSKSMSVSPEFGYRISESLQSFVASGKCTINVAYDEASRCDALEPHAPSRVWVATMPVVIADTSAETTQLSTSSIGSLTFPADYWTVGTAIRFATGGRITAGNTQTTTFKITLDGVDLINNTGTLPNGLTDCYIKCDFDMMCRADGKICGIGHTLIQITTGIEAPKMRGLIALSPTTIDRSKPMSFNCTYKWATKSTGNILTIAQASLTRSS